MKDFEKLIKEIQNLRKMMDLPLNESDLKSKILLNESAEGRAVRNVLEEIAPSLKNLSDTQLDLALSRNPVNIELKGVVYQIRSLSDVTRMTGAYRSMESARFKSDADALRELIKNNDPQITAFRESVANGTNYMNMRVTRESVALAKGDYVAGSVDSRITSDNFTLDTVGVDDALDNFETNFLGKNTSGRETTDGSFDDSFYDRTLDTLSSDQLTNVGKEVETYKKDFSRRISEMRKTVTDAENSGTITKEQATNLNEKITVLQKKGENIFDVTKKYYDDAALTRQNAEDASRIGAARNEPLFRLDTELDPTTPEGQAERALYQEMNNNISREMLGTSSGFRLWMEKYFGSSGKFLKMPVENFITWYESWARTINRSDRNPLYTAINETLVGGETRGTRYSYDEIKVRFELITNQMLDVIRENLEYGGKQGETKIKDSSQSSVENELRGLFRKMQDIAGMQKFAGNLEDLPQNIRRLQDDLANGRIDQATYETRYQNLFRDNTRIVQFLSGGQFQKLEDLITNLKTTIDTAATENKEGAKELKELWEKISSESVGDKFNTFAEFIKSLDDYMKKRRTPNAYWDVITSKDGWNDLVIFVSYFKNVDMGKPEEAYEALEKSWLLGSGAKFGKYDIGKFNPVQIPVKILNNLIPPTKLAMGRSVQFFNQIITVLYKEFFIGALSNQFKYGRMTSISEMDRILQKYGPGKSTVILLLREVIIKLTFSVLSALMYYAFNIFDSIIGGIMGDFDKRPMQTAAYWGLAYVGETAEKNKETGIFYFVDSDGAMLNASQFNEWVQKDFTTKVASFFQTPSELRKLVVGAGIPGDIANILTFGYANKWRGLDNDPDYFVFRRDNGWFNSQLDEVIVNMSLYVAGAIKSKVNDLRILSSEFDKKIDEAEDKIKKWEQEGVLWGEETVAQEARQNSENRLDNEIDRSNGELGIKYQLGPKEFETNKDLFDKFKAIVNVEFEPDFNKELTDEGILDEAKRQADGVKKWKKWFYGDLTQGIQGHKDFVGITDAKLENGIIKNGVFYRIDTGEKLGFGIQGWYRIVDSGRVVTGPNGRTEKGHLYIHNPKDDKYYHFSLLFDVISKEKILQLYELRHAVYETKMTLEKWGKYIKYVELETKRLEENIKTVDTYLTDEYKEKFPETYNNAYTRKYGGEIKDPISGEIKRYKGYVKELEKLKTDYEKNKSLVEKSIDVKENIIKKIIMSEMKKYNRYRLFEEEEQRFGENKFDHWYDTFTFQKYDEKTNDFKDIDTDTLKHGLIKDRFNDFIKNYDGDDAFVRAVVDTHPDVVRIKYLKDQANIQETYYPTGLASVLSLIRESKGEYDIFSVSRLKGGNWHLVKGDFTQKEMSNMVLTKQVPPEKQPKQRENGLESLKKKEATGTAKLASDETEGLKELPKRVKEKLKEKISKGWTTETPPKVFHEFYEESELNSVFNDKIKIYKLEPTPEFFNSLKDNSSHVLIRKGFCRSMTFAKRDGDISNEQRKVVNHILNKCDEKFEGKLGLSYLSKRS